MSPTFSTFNSLSLVFKGVTAVDGYPGQAFSNCYPVVLDGAVQGWVEAEFARIVADTLRSFKVCRLCKTKCCICVIFAEN